MALQTGIGLSRLLLLAGAGYTGTIMFKNGKLSELLGELQAWVKGLEKSGEQVEGDSEYSDVMGKQVRQLANEIRHLRAAQQITVLNGTSGQMSNLSGLIIPAATLGALGYGYMWWKGLKFSDLMYVTKRGMANAVSNLTKHLEQVSEALAAAKTHLTQRMQHLDDKLETQKEISKTIQNDVNAVTENLSQVGADLWMLRSLVSNLDGKIGTLEEKQDLSNMGVLYLCNFAGGKQMKMPKALEDQLKSSARTRTLTAPSLKGLKELADDLSSTINEPATDAIMEDGIDTKEDQPQILRNDQPRALLRFNSARC